MTELGTVWSCTSVEWDPALDSGAAASDSARANAGRQLDFRPGMDMQWEVTRTTADTAGELFEATNWVAAGMGGPPVHVHPTAEESYAVVEGTMDVFVGGEWTTLRAGETATVPPDTPHTLRNSSPEPVRIVNVHRPALKFESFFREMHALIGAGKIKRLPPKDPRSAIYAAMLFQKYPAEIRVVKPPNGIFKALAVIGRGLGFKLEG
jgi:mannose-6-phosphate isomerase-like protein (cupin superfamily)